MNYNCLSDCKFKAVCNLNAEQTLRCKVADDKGVDHSNKNLISGLTSKDICRMQGRDGDIKEQHEMLGWEPSLNECRNAAYHRAHKETLERYLRYVEPLNKMKARYLETEFTGIVLHPDGRVETTLSDDCKEAIKEIDRLQAHFLKTLVIDELKALGINEGDLK